MSRWTCLLLASLCWGSPIWAQTVMKPEPPLDSARAALRDALLILRDTLNTVDGAAARLQRDFRQASAQALLSRARVMRDACSRSVRAVPPARKAVADTKLSGDRRVKQRARLVGAMNHLSEALTRCELDFAAMSEAGQGEKVRGYGNDRAGRVQSALRGYESSLRAFLGAMGIKIRPLGADTAPPAS
jgi:hypothetical protein